MMENSRSIVLGGGCFWCLEASYQLLRGVESALPGYAGGETPSPTYEQVSLGDTGHAEVVRVIYDPSEISLDEILAVFWTIHDPTSLNQQGADIGTQYASVIFYESDDDRAIIDHSLGEARAALDTPIVTRVEPLDVFYEAEEYHHDYFEKNPGASYCRVVIDPKLHKLRQHFSSLLRS
jgi:peptide-methionine (S)-S-oxide reductase